MSRPVNPETYDEIRAGFRTSPSKTEVEVLQAIVNGATTPAQIAQACFITPRTATTHASNIMKVYGSPNLLDAVLRALKTGVISLSE